MLIVDPLLSNSTLLPVPVSDDLPDAILNPPAMSEPDADADIDADADVPHWVLTWLED